MKSKFILILAVIMAIITTVLFRQYMVSLDKKYKAANQIVTVVVPKTNIETDKKITADMLTTKEVSAGSILSDALKKSKDVEGKYALTDLKAGEVLYTERLTDQSTENDEVTRKISEGARAVSIGVTDVTAVAKMIQPEDRVDVVYSINGQTSIVAENIRVLAVGKILNENSNATNEKENTSDYGTITLELWPGDVVKVINADENGTIKFVLRGKYAP